MVQIVGPVYEVCIDLPKVRIVDPNREDLACYSHAAYLRLHDGDSVQNTNDHIRTGKPYFALA